MTPPPPSPPAKTALCGVVDTIFDGDTTKYRGISRVPLNNGRFVHGGNEVAYRKGHNITDIHSRVHAIYA